MQVTKMPESAFLAGNYAILNRLAGGTREANMAMVLHPERRSYDVQPGLHLLHDEPEG